MTEQEFLDLLPLSEPSEIWLETERSVAAMSPEELARLKVVSRRFQDKAQSALDPNYKPHGGREEP